MTVLIQLTTAGTDTGPFNLYSDLDSFGVPFEVGVTKVDLLSGYLSSLVPDFTTTIRVCSTSLYCSNCIDITVEPLPTTTTTSSSSTSSTTTSSTSTTTSTTTSGPAPFDITADFSCADYPSSINVGIASMSGGTVPYYVGPGTFASEAAALANTSWTLATSIAYSIAPVNGTYWVVGKDSVGAIVAKSVTTNCSI
jgi:hypothetical protein